MNRIGLAAVASSLLWLCTHASHAKLLSVIDGTKAIDGRRGFTALQMAEAGKHAAVIELLKPAP